MTLIPDPRAQQAALRAQLPTAESRRLIAEGSVVALIETKLESLEERLAKGRIGQIEAFTRSGALKSVQADLTYISTVEPDAVLQAVARDAIIVLEGLVHPSCRRENDIIARLQAALGETPEPVRVRLQIEEEPEEEQTEYFVTEGRRGRWDVREPKGAIVTSFVTRATADAFAAEQTRRLKA